MSNTVAFHETSLVQTPQGLKRASELTEGEEVVIQDRSKPLGTAVISEVYRFTDRNRPVSVTGGGRQAFLHPYTPLPYRAPGEGQERFERVPSREVMPYGKALISPIPGTPDVFTEEEMNFVGALLMAGAKIESGADGTSCLKMTDTQGNPDLSQWRFDMLGLMRSEDVWEGRSNYGPYRLRYSKHCRAITRAAEFFSLTDPYRSSNGPVKITPPNSFRLSEAGVFSWFIAGNGPKWAKNGNPYFFSHAIQTESAMWTVKEALKIAGFPGTWAKPMPGKGSKGYLFFTNGEGAERLKWTMSSFGIVQEESWDGGKGKGMGRTKAEHVRLPNSPLMNIPHDPTPRVTELRGVPLHAVSENADGKWDYVRLTTDRPGDIIVDGVLATSGTPTEKEMTNAHRSQSSKEFRKDLASPKGGVEEYSSEIEWDTPS